MVKKDIRGEFKPHDILDFHKSIATISFSHSLSHDNFVARGLIVLNSVSFITIINISPLLIEKGSSARELGSVAILFGVGVVISSVMAFMLMSIASQMTTFYADNIRKIYLGETSVEDFQGYGFSRGGKTVYLIFLTSCVTALGLGWYKVISIFWSASSMSAS